MQELQVNTKTAPRLGLGTWAIGGPFFSDDQPLGWGEVDDHESVKAIEAAYEAGIRLFDTADVYGAGHAETLLGQSVGSRDDVIISTKFGVEFDAATKKVTGSNVSPDYIRFAIDQSCHRLRRQQLDLVFLHLNTLDVSDAVPVFDCLDALVDEGQIGAYGWSTDFPDRASFAAARQHTIAIQHGMNVFFAASKVRASAEGLWHFNRSPLAMGLLSDPVLRGEKTLSETDIRSRAPEWLSYFKDGKPVPEFLERLQTIEGHLRSNGRTIVQGALGYLLGKSDKTVPIPGFRTVAQVNELVGALEFGPLAISEISAIDALLPAEDPEIRER